MFVLFEAVRRDQFLVAGRVGPDIILNMAFHLDMGGQIRLGICFLGPGITLVGC